MSKRIKQTFKVTALAAALFAVYGSALAEGPENSVSVGIGNWSSDRLQGGIYDGMRDSGAYGLLDADITKRDEATGTWLGLKARNLGVDNREIMGEWLRQGDIGASLEFSSIRRDQPFVYNTGLRGIGTTTQTVTNITPGNGANLGLHTNRDRLTAKFFKNLGVGLNLNVSFRNEEKDGLRHWGRGGAAEFAVEPIDSTTRLLEATLSYARDRMQLSGGFYGTSYTNANSMVTAIGSSTYYLSLPLDNKS
ncbi:MAG: MtrB/PioB family outer membrane beta-barrel protein, partial [Burkholderiales bacterium]|nr:MtrB/PioB family outer membrane beta-barrel protein [Burkholderiales bacterium]